MHFLLCIADRLDVERKLNENALCDDLRISIHDDLTSLNQIMRELKSDRKIVSESKIKKLRR